MRILAIDHGSRRIGLAVGDTETRMAFARGALRMRSHDDAIARLSELARAEGAERVIVGLPLNMDGSEGPQAAAARAFGGQLASMGMDVVYVDERLSSWEARERMAQAGRQATRRSGELDSAAAAIILQQYLDMTEETE